MADRAARNAPHVHDQVELWPVERLRPCARNPRKHSADQVAAVARSIATFGLNKPVLVDPDGEIVAGEAIWRACRRLELPEVPVIVLHHLTPAQREAFRVADNKLGELSGWDDEKLAAVMADLQAADFDLPVLGFAPDDVTELLAPKPPASAKEETAPAPEPEVFTISRRGDTWCFGAHRVTCGDATNAEDVARTLRGEAPVLMVTDQPYGVEYEPGWRSDPAVAASIAHHTKGAKGKVRNDNRVDLREAWALFTGDVAYVWCASLHSAEVLSSLTACGFERRAQIIWNKSVHVISRGHYHWKHEPCWYAVRKGKTAHWRGDRKQSTVWDIPTLTKSEARAEDARTNHGTQKPLECMLRPIQNHARPGQKVYDPFLGSGTTLIAAEQSGRIAFGLEIDPGYVDVIVKRWQRLTNKPAVHADTGRTFEDTAQDRAGT